MSEPRKSVSEELRACCDTWKGQIMVPPYLVTRAADEIDRLTAAKSGVGITDEMARNLLAEELSKRNLTFATAMVQSGPAQGSFVQSAIAAIQRAPLTAAIGKMEGWRPISEAPKDGRKFLCCRQCEQGVGLGWWEPDWYGSACWVNGYISILPTHWQPLPSPPPTSDGGGE